jgi:hypothetical protein
VRYDTRWRKDSVGGWNNINGVLDGNNRPDLPTAKFANQDRSSVDPSWLSHHPHTFHLFDWFYLADAI